MLMPRISFTWLVAMMIAAADVKPTETGPEMKSNRKPNEREKMCKNIFKMRYN